MMQDPQGRTIDGLRISLNRACNLRCLYFHNEGRHDGADRMGPDDIGTLVRAAASLRTERLKIMGGEPLLRPDVEANDIEFIILKGGKKVDYPAKAS